METWNQVVQIMVNHPVNNGSVFEHIYSDILGLPMYCVKVERSLILE